MAQWEAITRCPQERWLEVVGGVGGKYGNYAVMPRYLEAKLAGLGMRLTLKVENEGMRSDLRTSFRHVCQTV